VSGFFYHSCTSIQIHQQSVSTVTIHYSYKSFIN